MGLVLGIVKMTSASIPTRNVVQANVSRAPIQIHVEVFHVCGKIIDYPLWLVITRVLVVVGVIVHRVSLQGIVGRLIITVTGIPCAKIIVILAVN